MRFEVIAEVNGVKWNLDTYKSEPINITYNVADIADIASRNSTFSKTIKLPDTKNNRQVFGDIADLSVDSTFNPNKKARAWLLVDTLVVIEGYLQLRKVFYNKSLQVGEFEAVIYADNDNFYKLLQDKNLTDLDFSELNHDYTYNNIVQSWTASWNNGYYYPLIDYGQDWELGDINGWSNTYKTYVGVNEMYPSTNVKYIFDKIFSSTGYSYISNFLNGDLFKDLYIPFNKSGLTRDLTTSEGRFTVGRVEPISATTGYIQPFSYLQASTSSNILLYIQQGNDPAEPNDQPICLFRGKIPFNNEDSPYGDPSSDFNTTTFNYEAPSNFTNASFTCDFDITFPYNPGGVGYDAFANGGWYAGSFSPYAWICFRRSRNPLTGATVSPSVSNPTGGYTIPIGGSTTVKRFIPTDIPNVKWSGGTYLTGYTNAVGQITSDILNGTTASNTRRLYPGEKVWVEVFYSVPIDEAKQKGLITVNPLNSSLGVIASNRTLITFNTPNRLWNNQSTIISPTELLEYNNVIPKNIKQKEFISSIIKMFNLIVEPSKDYEKTLLIEPRDDYFNSGQVKDWTRKLDISGQLEEQILGETQNKKTILKYKDDKDFYNEDYPTTTGSIRYGQYDYYIDNDFISGEKKIEVIFSPTPMVGIYNNNSATEFAIPKIVKERQVQPQPFTDHNIRILTRFSSSTEKTWRYGDYQFRSGGAYNGYTTLTSQGFGYATHSFNVGDYIQVRQDDGGALKPVLQANFQVVEVVNTRTITIDIPFSTVGSGVAIGGTATPLKGLVGLKDTLTWKFENTFLRCYPYLGHYDHPIYPSYDINFGQVQGLYYPQTITTNDNLFELFWSNMLNEISDKDSRIIRGNFYLTAADIADFKFSDKIYISNQYYKVNKIEGYDPTQEKLTKVELIKSKFITIPRKYTGSKKPWQINVSPIPIDRATNIPIREINLRPGGSIGTTGNVILGSGVVVGGRENYVYRDSIVIGRGNVVASEGTQVVGSNNDIQGGVIASGVLGSNNLLGLNYDGLSQYVIGSGNTHSGSGLLVGENNFIGAYTTNTHIFGSDNIVDSPVLIDFETATASATSERVFIIGNSNTVSNPTFSEIRDIFIQGTNSTILSNSATVFGSGVVLASTASNTIVIGDNIVVSDANSLVINKNQTRILSYNTEVLGTASLLGPKVEVNTGVFQVSASTSTFGGLTTFTNPVSFNSQVIIYGTTSYAGGTDYTGTVSISGPLIITGTVSITASQVSIATNNFNVAGTSSFVGTASFDNTVFIKDIYNNTVDLSQYIRDGEIVIPDTVNATVPTKGFTTFIDYNDLPKTTQGDFTGETISGRADANVSVGQVAYLFGGGWKLAVADNLGLYQINHNLGAVVHTALTLQDTTILLRGFYSPGIYFTYSTAPIAGEPVYICNSTRGLGFVSTEPPTNPSDVVRIIGYVHDITYPYTVRFSPDPTWIEYI